MQWKFNDADPIKRFEQFVVFADWWFELDQRHRPLAELDLDKELDGLKIPAVLRRFYKAAFNWPFDEAFGGENHFGWNQDYFVYPNRLKDSELLAERGLLTFIHENQGVTAWACKVNEIDPPVWDRESEVGEEPYPYCGICSSSLADFLIQFLLNQICLQGDWVRTNPDFQDFIESSPQNWQSLMVDQEIGTMPEVGLYKDEVLISKNPYGWVIAARRPEARKTLGSFLTV